MQQGRISQSEMDRYLPPEAVMAAAEALWGGPYDGDPARQREWLQTMETARRATLAAAPALRRAGLMSARAYFVKKKEYDLVGKLDALGNVERLNEMILSSKRP